MPSAVKEIEDARMDVAITEPIHLVEDRAKGKAIVGFARFLHTNGGVMYFRGGSINRPRDMKGKRIQYPGAPGSAGPAIVATMIEADGSECDPTQFGLVNNGFYHTDALAEARADVATLVFYNFEIIEARERGFDAGYFALKDWGVPDFCQLILITSPRTLEERRETLERLLGVLRRGVDFLHERPEDAKEIYDRQAGADPNDRMMQEIFAATIQCFTYDFSMSAEYYQKLQGWMHTRGLISKPYESSAYWTNDLVV
jgi:ABC-type nitrate/sulfonate/bicarbonate transport system substrate-binding protein